MDNKDVVINGFRIGEYTFDPENVIDEIQEKQVEGMNYVHISTNCYPESKGEIPQHYFLDWAKYLSDRKLYFCFNGGGDRKPAGFTEETARKMKEIAVGGMSNSKLRYSEKVMNNPKNPDIVKKIQNAIKMPQQRKYKNFAIKICKIKDKIQIFVQYLQKQYFFIGDTRQQCEFFSHCC